NLGGTTHLSHASSTVILSITHYDYLIVFDYINNIYQATTLISGCYNGTLCSWDNDCLKQIHVNAHPSSIIIDINISDHSSTKR
ncbi:unnamed protein product, partial [Rotaria sp. Silwood1]